MPDTEKDKADKIAAAKKRYEQIKKQKEKSKKTGEKSTEQPVKKKEPTKAEPEEDKAGQIEGNEEDTIGSAEKSRADDGPETTEEMATANENEKPVDLETTTPTRTGHGRQPSLSIQSRLRSTSFRKASQSQATPLSPSATSSKGPGLPPLSPEGDSVHEIYRKQALRIEELERENKRLSREAETSQTRQRRTEEELEELRENAPQIAELKSRADRGEAKNEEMIKLKAEITTLQRQNSHLQSQKGSRHSMSPSQAFAYPPSDLQAQLDSKSSTIESMELEISNLRAQLSKTTSSTDSQSSQVAALEGKLERAERAAGAAQRELLDVRKNLDRASEKAVKEGSERTSAEIKIRTLTREAAQSSKAAEEALKRAETLEKKLSALTTLHKEADARRQTGERERERLDRESAELRRRAAGLEGENTRLREERERLRRREAGGTDDEGLDELEDEERKKLEARVRELEGELSEAQRGIWREKRRTMQGGLGEEAVVGPSAEFDEVDLMGEAGSAGKAYGKQHPAKAPRSSSFATVLTSGINAFTATADRSGSMDLLDDDMGFDEGAFRAAQEEDALKRVERVKEVKRGLKDWEGFHLDMVDLRMSGGGFGEVFDI